MFLLSPHIIIVVDRFFGATTLQAWSYFIRFRDDELWIKAIVRKPKLNTLWHPTIQDYCLIGSISDVRLNNLLVRIQFLLTLSQGDTAFQSVGCPIHCYTRILSIRSSSEVASYLCSGI